MRWPARALLRRRHRAGMLFRVWDLSEVAGDSHGEVTWTEYAVVGGGLLVTAALGFAVMWLLQLRLGVSVLLARDIGLFVSMLALYPLMLVRHRIRERGPFCAVWRWTIATAATAVIATTLERLFARL
jgi:hypothetical protein